MSEAKVTFEKLPGWMKLAIIWSFISLALEIIRTMVFFADRNSSAGLILFLIFLPVVLGFIMAHLGNQGTSTEQKGEDMENEVSGEKPLDSENGGNGLNHV